jgi:3-methyladenine DNA glycosylase AlkC
MSENNTLLKDIYFSEDFVQRLAGDLAEAYPDFDSETFIACALSGGFSELALKEKMRHLTTCLHTTLPPDFAEALPILLAVAPGFPDFDGMVFSDYVAVYGLDDWDRSLPALRELTRTISAEFAIRPFLRHDPRRAMPYLVEWAADPDPAVRRLASEGCRPRLPWGMALPAFKRDPAPVLPILEKLKDDPSEDVRRSVANNLNDISKDNPQIVLEVAERWSGDSEEVDRVVKHACRTLLKSGDVRAMRLFGFAEPSAVRISGLAVDPPEPLIGDDIYFSYTLHVEAVAPLLLRLEYIMTFARARGKTSNKVFFLREGEFQPGTQEIRKKHSFRDLSTRKHYPGKHMIEIVVNGVIKSKISLQLLPAPT